MTFTRLLSTLLLTAGLSALGCSSKNPVSDDTGGGNPNPGGDPYTRDQFTFDGQVDTTADGYDVVGTMKVESDQGSVEFVNADVSLHFDDQGRMTGISGTVQIPSPSPAIEFTNPVEAEVGYYPGTYINSHPEFTLQVKDTRNYFVYYFAVALEMKIGTSGDTAAHKPFTVKAPIGGKTVMIADYDDPLMYTYGEQDILGATGTGDSEKGLIPYSPVQPLAHFNDFDGQSIRVGAFDVLKVLGVQGSIIRSTRFTYDLLSDDPIGSLGAGTYAGINGAMDFTVGIKDVLGFTVPMGEASAGVSVEVSAAAASGLEARCALNGLVDPDLSWWPSIVGFTPSGQLRATGHVISTGDFSLALAGGFSLLTPGSSDVMQGSAQVTQDAFTLAASRTTNGMTLEVDATVKKDTTDFGVTVPDQIKFDANTITQKLDEELAEVDQALTNLESAIAGYEFELSLRGLRQTLPGLVDAIKAIIADRVSSAKQQVRDAADWCSGSPDLSDIDDVVAPYYTALNRLKAAALNTTDNATTRSEIEAALRDLAARYRINTDVTISGQVRVVVCVSFSVTRAIDITVLTTAQRNQLLTAANNVKYIKETSDIMIQAQQIYDAMDPRSILQQVRDEVNANTALIPSLDRLGILHTHSPSTWEPYAVFSGTRVVLGPFDPLDPASIVDVVSTAIINLLKP